MTLTSASTLDMAALTELFNAGFTGYLIPMRLSEEALNDHVATFDIDLDLSQVVLDGGPVAFALVARRGGTGWIGGMGTAPPHRRRGLGEKALMAALEAAAASGCDRIVLEVLERNQPAIELYSKIGFETVRDLEVWSLPPAAGEKHAAARAVEVVDAQRWIAAHRSAAEPWQRADETLVALKRRGIDLSGLVFERDREVVAAAVFHERPETVVVLQVAAVDEDAAGSILNASAGSNRALRLSNIPPGEPASRAMRLLGADHVANQHEMALRIS